MGNRVELNEEFMDNVVGGKITFDWDGKVGHCGLNGDKSYTFNDKKAFVNFAVDAHNKGVSDSECLSQMVAAGIIY